MRYPVRPLAIAVFLLLPNVASTAQPPGGFRDIPWGAGREVVLSRFPSAECVTNSETVPGYSDEHCFAKTTVGTAPVEVLFRILDPRSPIPGLQGYWLTFHPEFFDEIRRALVQRYGAPARSGKRVVELPSKEDPISSPIAEWDGPGTWIRLRKYGVSTALGLLTVMTTAALNEDIRRWAERSNRGGL